MLVTDAYVRRFAVSGEKLPQILEAAHMGRVTLLFGSKELEINNAVALKHFLDPRL